LALAVAASFETRAYEPIDAIDRIPAELHVDEDGEHGFGVRQKDQPTDAWTEACVAWLRGLGVLQPGRAPARAPAKRVDG
jgi:hypothetical protein